MAGNLPHQQSFTKRTTQIVDKCKVLPITRDEDREEAEVWFYYFFNLGARCKWVVNATPRLPDP
jgi:hypothetical protein